MSPRFQVVRQHGGEVARGVRVVGWPVWAALFGAILVLAVLGWFVTGKLAEQRANDALIGTVKEANNRLTDAGQAPVGDPSAIASAASQGTPLGQITGAPGAPGAPGSDGRPGSDSTVSGPPGPPGRPGADSTVPGPPGPPGSPGSPGRDGTNGTNGTGAPGRDGANGADGVGTPGRDGAAGVPGADSTVPGPAGPAGPVGANGSPPLSWSWTWQGQQFVCLPVSDGFDPAAPRYECAALADPPPVTDPTGEQTPEQTPEQPVPNGQPTTTP